jgi:hypothetical protein
LIRRRVNQRYRGGQPEKGEVETGQAALPPPQAGP